MINHRNNNNKTKKKNVTSCFFGWIILVSFLLIWDIIQFISFHRQNVATTTETGETTLAPSDGTMNDNEMISIVTDWKNGTYNFNKTIISESTGNKMIKNITTGDTGSITVSMKTSRNNKNYRRGDERIRRNRISKNTNHHQNFIQLWNWWEPYIEATSYIYPKWNNNNNNNNDFVQTNHQLYDWCHLEYKDEWDSSEKIALLQQQNENKNEEGDNDDKYNQSSMTKISGLMYVKSYKAASSTCEGINMAIAHHVAARKQQQQQQQLLQQELQELQEQQNIQGEEKTLHVTSNITTMTTKTTMTQPDKRRRNNADSINNDGKRKMICRHYNRHEFANLKLHENRYRRKHIHLDHRRKEINNKISTSKSSSTTTTTINTDDQATLPSPPSPSSSYDNTHDTNGSLLWTFVRYPSSRDLSQVFHFRVSRQGIDPTSTGTGANNDGTTTTGSNNNNDNTNSTTNNDINPSQRIILEALADQKSKQTNYLLPNTQLVNELSKNVRLWINQYPRRLIDFIHINVVSQYDFIGVTERMEESLAVMTLLFDLHVTDVIVLNAKQSGLQYDAGGQRKRCTKIKSFRTVFGTGTGTGNVDKFGRMIQKYLNSTEHRRYNVDYLLYYAIDLSLNRTIESLGKDIVQQRRSEIRYWQNLANEKCQSKAIYPCSNSGTYQEEISKTNCYIQDAGCGYPCIDELIFEKKTAKRER